MKTSIYSFASLVTFVVLFFGLVTPAAVYGNVSLETGGYTYSANNFVSASNPTGGEVTHMNLSSPGDIVKIKGEGFGERNLDDFIPEMIYVANSTTGGMLTIYRGIYDSAGPHYFGIKSWTDTEIELEVAGGFGEKLGSYIQLRTYTSSDLNQGTSVRGDLSVFIPDTTFPVITINGSNTMNLNAGESFEEPGFTATDNVDGNITNKVTVSGDEVDTKIPGLYTIKYSVIDTSGNVSPIVTRVVNVIDSEAPLFIGVPSNKTIEATSAASAVITYSLPTAIDNVDGTVSVTCTPDIGALVSIGVYTITCSAIDAAGNQSQVTFSISIVINDTVAPILTLNGAATNTTAFKQSYNDSGATAIDNVDGDISDSIVVNGLVVTNQAGTYVLKFRVSDIAGNTSEIYRTVTVTSPSSSKGGGGGGKSKPKVEKPVKPLVLGVSTTTSTTQAITKQTEAELKLALQRQLILLLTQLIALLQQKI